MTAPPRCAGRRIATTYPFLLGRYLEQHSLRAEIVTLSGAVEIAPRLGRADLICDLVSTGSTLQANHLREVETVLESHAVLIRTPIELAPDKHEWVERLLLRIEGVEQVKESKYIMLHAPRSALPAIRGCCRAASRRPSFRSRARPIAWPCTRCAARTCSGKRSRV